MIKYYYYFFFLVPVVKRTWAPNVKNIEFYSDIDDPQIPTIKFDEVPNAEQGHCAKTIAIIRKFIQNHQKFKWRWLVIADDDTLIR